MAWEVQGGGYGLADGIAYTPDEVAALIRLPEAAVRQIEATALTTLRNALTAD